MQNILNLFSLLLLLSAIVLITNKHITAYIRTFQVQSLLIIIGALFVAMENHHWELLVVSVLIFLLKVIYIPRYLHKTSRKTRIRNEKDFYLNIPILTFVACVLIAVVYFCIEDISLIRQNGNITPLCCNLSVILIGLLFMMSRKKALGQIIGFLVIENGLFSTALFTTHGMPLIIDLGIFIDLLTGVIIMSLIVFQINDKFDTTNTHQLTTLKG